MWEVFSWPDVDMKLLWYLPEAVVVVVGADVVVGVGGAVVVVVVVSSSSSSSSSSSCDSSGGAVDGVVPEVEVVVSGTSEADPPK